MSVGLRPCGLQGWAVCDGNCEKCQTTATTHTLYNPIEIARKYAPTIEAEPVKHGRWMEDEYGIPHCSECKAINNTVYRNYCPNCGADMRERREDE